MFAIFILFSLSSLQQISCWPPDADKIAMDGVFVHDFIGELPQSLTSPYQYAIKYYARYPSLSIGQRPFFFPAVQALFYGLMGITYLAPRLAVLCFLFMGMFFWVRLVTRTHDFETALLSVMLWISNPYIYVLSQNILLEIPTISMCILILYLLHDYVNDAHLKSAVFLGIVTGLTLWTSQKSAFILPLFLLYPICRKKTGITLQKENWVLLVIILLFLIPLVIMTYKFGALNIAISLKSYTGPEQMEIINQGHSQLWVYLSFLINNHFSLPILALSVLGMAISVLKRNTEALLYALYILCIYATFTLLSVKIPRYTVYWIPGFCLFAAVPMVALSRFLSDLVGQYRKTLFYILCLVPFLFQFFQNFPINIIHVFGYESAARYVLSHSNSPVLFFTGTGIGQFSFFVRKHDPDMTHMVLRGQKIISTTLINDGRNFNVLLETEDEIYNALQKMGVQFAVVEKPLQVPKIPAYKAFSHLLGDKERFMLKKIIPLEISPRFDRHPHSLMIYENRQLSPVNRNETLKLHMPAASDIYKVNLGDMTGNKAGE